MDERLLCFLLSLLLGEYFREIIICWNISRGTKEDLHNMLAFLEYEAY